MPPSHWRQGCCPACRLPRVHSPPCNGLPVLWARCSQPHAARLRSVLEAEHRLELLDSVDISKGLAQCCQWAPHVAYAQQAHGNARGDRRKDDVEQAPCEFGLGGNILMGGIHTDCLSMVWSRWMVEGRGASAAGRPGAGCATQGCRRHACPDAPHTRALPPHREECCCQDAGHEPDPAMKRPLPCVA